MIWRLVRCSYRDTSCIISRLQENSGSKVGRSVLSSLTENRQQKRFLFVFLTTRESDWSQFSKTHKTHESGRSAFLKMRLAAVNVLHCVSTPAPPLPHGQSVSS